MNNELKEKIMNEIESHAINFSVVSPSQYRIRCPICGDSSKNKNSAHCYIKCDYEDPSEPILYNCFKCNNSGTINELFLSQLGIENIKIKNERYNKISYKKANIEILTGEVKTKSPQAFYLQHRLRRKFTKEDLEAFKIVWDIGNLRNYITSKNILNKLPSNENSISFLSDDKSTLLTRSFNQSGRRWNKLKLIPSKNNSLYTIKTNFDIFQIDPESNLYIAEGIVDVISLYMMEPKGNNAFIATLGSHYSSGIEYAIMKGIIGKSINVKVFIDNDIDKNIIKLSLKKYKWLFKSIQIIENMKEKDVGVPEEDILLTTWRV